MARQKLATLVIHFADLEDPRASHAVEHPLINILVIGLCAIICGASTFTAMAEFGRSKRDWLAKFLDLSKGPPSHDTFNNVFVRLNPAQFEKCLLSWITALHEVTQGQILPIDGKTLRGSYDTKDGKAPIHMVSIWASANQLSLASRVVDEKSNEITAIPALLELIDVSGALITIDAMGCQKAIAKAIVAQGADFVLALKDNQPTLCDNVATYFTAHVGNDFADVPNRRHATKEKNHGRSDERSYHVVPVPEDWVLQAEWPEVRALGMVHRTSVSGDKHTDELRFYILSCYPSGKRFAEAVRAHWSIENNLHWQLDVTFREDDLRVRRDHAPANMSILMRTALSMLKNEKSIKTGIQTKRMAAGWNEVYLEKVLTQS
jgi:predicted transposase YbfD/YdcC